MASATRMIISTEMPVTNTLITLCTLNAWQLLSVRRTNNVKLQHQYDCGVAYDERWQLGQIQCDLNDVTSYET